MSGFEIFLLALYAVLMVIITVYSFHAYLMVYLYHRKGRARERKTVQFDQWPIVTVQLPVYNEQYVVERLITASCRLEYPRDRLEIQVLDDSTDETLAIAKELADRFRTEGVNIACIHRDDRTGFKAGALRAGLHKSTGEYLAIFDADFVPPADFLKRMMPHFSHDRVGLVQARWGHLNGDDSLLTRGQTIGLDAHFVIEHGARNASGIFMNFNGTAGIWRKRAIIDAGDWQDDTLTEDMDLSYRAQLAGWQFVYVNDVVCPAEVPAEVHGFKNQQYRWAKGAIQTAKKLLPRIWRDRTIPFLVKWEATVHLTNHIVFPVILLVVLLSLPMLVIKVSQSASRGFFIGATVFTVSAFSYPLFYIYAQREINRDWRKRACFLPILMAGAIGLSVINTKAVLGALLGRQSPFVRTPKYNLQTGHKRRWHGSKYRSTFNATFFLELLLGVYTTVALWYAVKHAELASIPFIFLYWIGFLFIGSLSVIHAVKAKS
ncbi:MAG: glycosyltransferase family 2 protein [Candidatus Edwardsbacteria bacterium]|nr:glycosyltransferase family 2 protein [Candidatus Edwardsbacteria bacterium]